MFKFQLLCITKLFHPYHVIAKEDSASQQHSQSSETGSERKQFALQTSLISQSRSQTCGEGQHKAISHRWATFTSLSVRYRNDRWQRGAAGHQNKGERECVRTLQTLASASPWKRVSVWCNLLSTECPCERHLKTSSPSPFLRKGCVYVCTTHVGIERPLPICTNRQF